jgi:DNA-binding MarR family transcriptional regulator
VKSQRAWRPSNEQHLVLAAMTRPMDAAEIAETIDYAIKVGTVDNHLETLARRGFVRDSGERTTWTKRGRRWRYELTPTGKDAAAL